MSTFFSSHADFNPADEEHKVKYACIVAAILFSGHLYIGITLLLLFAGN